MPIPADVNEWLEILFSSDLDLLQEAKSELEAEEEEEEAEEEE